MYRLLSLVVAAAACLSGAAAQPPQFPRCGAAGDGAASAADWPRATAEAPPDAWQAWRWSSAAGGTLEQYTWVTWDGACATRQPCIVGGRPLAEGSEECEPGCYEPAGASDLTAGLPFLKPADALEPDSPGAYAQTVLLMAGLWAALAAMTLLCGCGCAAWSCATLCCRCKEGDAESCWGQPRSLLAFRAMSSVPLAIMIAFALDAEVSGNARLVPSLQAVLESPQAFGQLAEDGFQLAEDAVGIGHSVLDEAVRVNETLSAALDFEECSDALLCIENMLAGLPDVSAVRAELVRVQGGVAMLPDSAEISAVFTDVRGTVQELQGALAQVEAAVNATKTSLAELTGRGGALSALRDTVGTAVGTLTAAQADAADLSSAVATFLAGRPEQILSSASRLRERAGRGEGGSTWSDGRIAPFDDRTARTSCCS
eukprot:COSAG04_NODE_1166_length_7988_cov_6.987958_10_plen_429_part_00